MSLQRLPIYLDPIKMADNRAKFNGTLSFDGMERLRQVIIGTQGEIALDLECGIDVQGIRYLHGKIHAKVELACQRCLQVYIYPIDSSFCLSPVQDDQQAKQLPSHYEALFLAEGILLRTIIEDELLLNLPIIAIHDPEQCTVKIHQEVVSRKPFAKLKSLKLKK